MGQFLEDQQQNNVSGITLSEIKDYKKKVFIRIFTPGSSRLGSPLALPPIDGQLLKKDAAEEAEEYSQRVDEIVLSMVKTLGVTTRHQDRFATFLREIIHAGNNSGDFDQIAKLINKKGPSHSPIFRVSVSCLGKDNVFGMGKTIREAERLAAEKFLNKYKKMYEK